jgi:hypothetical protein
MMSNAIQHYNGCAKFGKLHCKLQFNYLVLLKSNTIQLL